MLNPAALQVIDAFSSPRTVADVQRLLPALAGADISQVVFRAEQLGLIQPAGHKSVLEDKPDTTLTAWLHVTGACNLCCTYCYVRREGRRMTPQTGTAALQTIFRAARRYGYGAVKLKYAGGEPTLNFSLVQALHAQACAQAAEYGLALHEVLLTNGQYLPDPMLRFIRDARMRLMISLDGIGPSHDAQRPRQDGASSFNRVSHTVDRALASGIAPLLSITVTGQDVGAPEQAVAFALERGLLFNLNFYRPADPSSGPGPDEGQLVEAVRRVFQIIEARLPPYNLLAGLLDRASFLAPHLVPCGAGRDYLAIDPSGQVANCHMDLDHPVSHVWEGDPLAAVRSRDTGWRNTSVDEKKLCHACTWRYVCAGGCPRLAGQGQAESPYCRAYKALYPELLRLEGLRVLRYQGIVQ